MYKQIVDKLLKFTRKNCRMVDHSQNA